MACQADLSRVCLVGQLTLPILEQQMALTRGGGLQPVGVRVKMVPQLVVLSPQRCPECGHPMMYVETQQVQRAGS